MIVKPVWVALAMMVAYSASAQPPFKTPTEESRLTQKAAQNKGQVGKGDQGTQERPFFVVVVRTPTVEVHGGPEGDEKSRQTTNGEKELAHLDQLYWGHTAEFWTVVFSGGAVIVGALTAIVFIFQSILLRRQVREMVKATAATEKAANAAKASAQETAFQAEDLRQTRILQHRPRLHVRNIVMHKPWFQRGSPIRGQFYVSNIGGMRAHVVGSHCEVLWNVNGLPMECPYEGKDANQPILDKPTIAAGSNATGIFTSDPNFRFDVTPTGNDPEGHKLYVLGWIEYWDDLAIRRRTAFCREFRQSDGSARFYPVADPDYEYEE
jgi:hypothetical protein